MKGRRFIAPEVVQSSALDCGPAALKSLLAGFGIEVSYGRLRDACQTSVDGTSIDTLEDVARRLGLEVEQEMLPADHLFAGKSDPLPALTVVLLPGGGLHFVVAWRRHGRVVQLMDPAKGRRWVSAKRFIDELLVHEMEVEADDWEEWARSDDFLQALQARAEALGGGASAIAALQRRAESIPGWQGLATLDAAVRLSETLIESGAVSRGREAHKLAETLFERALTGGTQVIPGHYWSARASDEAGSLILRGCVVLSIKGRAPATVDVDEEPLAPELGAALAEPPVHPLRAMWQTIARDGKLLPLLLTLALATAAAATLVEALLFRGLFDLGRDLVVSGQRMAGAAILMSFLAALTLLDVPIASGLVRLGRRLELRFRIDFLRHIAKLDDRYFASRLSSDLAERIHSVHRLRELPLVVGGILRDVFYIVLLVAGLCWVSPSTALVAIAAGTLAIVIPIAASPLLMERDLRLRTHLGALARFYLDALLGLVALRSHGADNAIRHEHDSLLEEWVDSGLRFQRAAVTLEALQLCIGFGMAAWLLTLHISSMGVAGALLVVYWALQLPVVGQDLALKLVELPRLRNIALRLYEPLGSRVHEEVEKNSEPTDKAEVAPACLRIEAGQIVAGGHLILDEIDLEIAAGEHIAVVGASGAGKSSLAALFLGLHEPSRGRVLIDGEPLVGEALDRLRTQTAWLDPSVQLWNQSLLDNLQYGIAEPRLDRVGDILDTASLRDLLSSLPDGLQESLGDSGRLLSGGEGQRVRLGRALLRPDLRLAIFDEPFRGLDRKLRTQLLHRSRSLLRAKTFVCITHDAEDTRDFDRVVVIHKGRIAEVGRPAELWQRGGHYASLLRASEDNREHLWQGPGWRQLRVREGQLVEERS